MRRTRYTVNMADDHRQVILAYNAAEATNYFKLRGYVVLSVDKGDYRALTATPSGAKPDWSAIKEAIAFLGIERPVDIKLNSRAQFQRGMCRTLPTHALLSRRGNSIVGSLFVMASEATWTHKISVSANQSPEEMGRTIWHELAHAMQFERDVPLDGTVSTALHAWHGHYRDGTSYADKPYEVEANDFMQYNDEMPLALKGTVK